MAIVLSALFRIGCPKNILTVIQIESPMVWHIHIEQWQKNHIKIYIHWEPRRILERPEATKGFDLVHLEQMHSAFQFKEHVHNQRHHYRLVQQRISAVKWLELYITDLKAKEILCIAAL